MKARGRDEECDVDREETNPLRSILRIPDQLLRISSRCLAPQLPKLFHGGQRLAEPVQRVDQRDDFGALEEVRIRVWAAQVYS